MMYQELYDHIIKLAASDPAEAEKLASGLLGRIKNSVTGEDLREIKELQRKIDYEDFEDFKLDRFTVNDALDDMSVNNFFENLQDPVTKLKAEIKAKKIQRAQNLAMAGTAVAAPVAGAVAYQAHQNKSHKGEGEMSKSASDPIDELLKEASIGSRLKDYLETLSGKKVRDLSGQRIENAFDAVSNAPVLRDLPRKEFKKIPVQENVDLAKGEMKDAWKDLGVGAGIGAGAIGAGKAYEHYDENAEVEDFDEAGLLDIALGRYETDGSKGGIINDHIAPLIPAAIAKQLYDKGAGKLISKEVTDAFTEAFENQNLNMDSLKNMNGFQNMMDDPDLMKRVTRGGIDGVKNMMTNPKVLAAVLGAGAVVPGVNYLRGSNLAEANGQEFGVGDALKAQYFAPFITPETIVKKKIRKAEKNAFEATFEEFEKLSRENPELAEKIAEAALQEMPENQEKKKPSMLKGALVGAAVPVAAGALLGPAIGKKLGKEMGEKMTGKQMLGAAGFGAAVGSSASPAGAITGAITNGIRREGYDKRMENKTASELYEDMQKLASENPKLAVKVAVVMMNELEKQARAYQEELLIEKIASGLVDKLTGSVDYRDADSYDTSIGADRIAPWIIAGLGGGVGASLASKVDPNLANTGAMIGSRAVHGVRLHNMNKANEADLSEADQINSHIINMFTGLGGTPEAAVKKKLREDQMAEFKKKSNKAL